MAGTKAIYEWPVRLFKMRGFGRVDVRYDGPRDRIVVSVARQSDGYPVKIDLPDGFASMTLEAFRHGPTDFPTISLKPLGDTSTSEMNPDDSVHG